MQNLRRSVKSIRLAVEHGGSPPLLREVTEAINSACYRHWCAEYQSTAEELVSSIAGGVPTPALSASGLETDEVVLTRYLAHYLNPENHHGLNDMFLRAVLGPEASGLEADWSARCSVAYEVGLGSYVTEEGHQLSGRIDIVIRGEDFAFAIEHKVRSPQDSDAETGLRQLQRYGHLLENWDVEDERLIKILLSPGGRSYANWQGVSHRDLVQRATPLLDDDAISEQAQANLRSLLIDLLLGPYERCLGVMDEIHDISLRAASASQYLGVMDEFESLLQRHSELTHIILVGRS